MLRTCVTFQWVLPGGGREAGGDLGRWEAWGVSRLGLLGGSGRAGCRDHLSRWTTIRGELGQMFRTSVAFGEAVGLTPRDGLIILSHWLEPAGGRMGWADHLLRFARARETQSMQDFLSSAVVMKKNIFAPF